MATERDLPSDSGLADALPPAQTNRPVCNPPLPSPDAQGRAPLPLKKFGRDASPRRPLQSVLCWQDAGNMLGLLPRKPLGLCSVITDTRCFGLQPYALRAQRLRGSNRPCNISSELAGLSHAKSLRIGLAWTGHSPSAFQKTKIPNPRGVPSDSDAEGQANRSRMVTWNPGRSVSVSTSLPAIIPFSARPYSLLW